MNQWSASLQRQLWSGGGLEVQYLGSHSYHLDRSFYNNTPLYPGPGSVNSRRPNPLFGVIRTINDDEIANYESMSVIFRFLASFVYDVPFFAVSNPLLKGMFTKWQANGNITIQTGIPFNVTTGTDTANTASSGTYRPDLVGPPSDNCGRGHLVGCINAAAFTVNDLYPITPTNYAYGNAGRNLLHGPGAQTVNFSLFKNFPIRERLKLQFRFESFAFLNHTNFGNPSATLNTSAFGNITSATGSRVIQFALKLQF